MTVTVEPVAPLRVLVTAISATPVTVQVMPGKGARGDPGPIGGGGHNHTQTVASDTWTINHNLGFKPDVALFSVGGQAIDADVLHVNINQTIVTFSVPVAGLARLS